MELDLFGSGSVRSDNYEVRIVKDICLRLGRLPPPPEAKFDWLHEEPTGIPARFGCKRLPYVHQISFTDLAGNKFAKLPFVRELEALREEVESELGAIFVFPWPHLGVTGSDMMVIHDLVDMQQQSSFCFTKKVKNGDVLTLQTLRALLEDLGLTPQ